MTNKVYDNAAAALEGVIKDGQILVLLRGRTVRDS